MVVSKLIVIENEMRKGEIQMSGKLCVLRYQITEDEFLKDYNATSLNEMVEALDEVGFYLSIEEGKLTIIKDDDKYRSKQTRNAGRRRNIAIKSNKTHFEAYRYAEIVCMMQIMTDREIAERINMPIATFYRHKKIMKSSSYYKTLDKNKMDDLEYLKSVDGNLMF